MGRRRTLGTAIGVTIMVCAVAGCAWHSVGAGRQTVAAAHATPSAFCTQILSFKPHPSMPFDEEGAAIRASAPMAPETLRGAVAVVMHAYDQIQDSEDGGLSMDQVTVPQTATFHQAMAAIDDYTAEHCGVHVAQELPVLPGN